MEATRRIRVALAGNPNSGKTTLFNALTGAHQRVGNYPGVTVEKRVGSYVQGVTHVEVHDLPGTYSLSAFSPEECVAQHDLLYEAHDAVVVVVDSTALSRSLMLFAQVLQTGARPILCLNMADEAAAAGQEVDLQQMRALLGCPVLETVGTRGVGVEDVKNAISDVVQTREPARRLVLGERLDNALAAIGEALDGTDTAPRQRQWIATKLLMNDESFVSAVRSGHHGAGERVVAEAERQRRCIESETGRDIHLFVTEQYFGFVDGLLREVVKKRPRADARRVSDRIDSVMVHRVLGLPIFAAVMYGIFWLTFTVGELPMGWIESGFAAIVRGITTAWPAGSGEALKSLIVDGVIGGVGGVLVFLPNILLLFLGLAFLEDTGYMARAAFLMDRVMHRFGLHGKSFIPMVTGFGCSIPGIMATRVLEDERDRLTTMLVLPLMSCGARLPIWMLLIPAFFSPPWRAPVLWLIYSTGIVLALALALLIRRSVLRGADTPFVMELPPYRMPTARALVTKMRERAWLYVRKAGTIILAISILMWAMTAYPEPDVTPLDAEIAAGNLVVATEDATEEDVTELRSAAPGGTTVLSFEQAEARRAGEKLERSAAGYIGRFIEPVVRPMGFDWKLGTALLGAFAAKEVFVAQLGVIYSMGEVNEGSAALRSALTRDYSPVVALSLMLFLLIATPCMATLAVTKRESGSWKWALLQFGGLTLIAYAISCVVYQFGSLFV